jgi:hypothetical protein
MDAAPLTHDPTTRTRQENEMGPEWRQVTVDGYERTYINLNNVCEIALEGDRKVTIITLVDGTKLFASEKPQDILDPRFGKG